jgi:hypothetical protein
VLSNNCRTFVEHPIFLGFSPELKYSILQLEQIGIANRFLNNLKLKKIKSFSAAFYESVLGHGGIFELDYFKNRCQKSSVKRSKRWGF